MKRHQQGTTFAVAGLAALALALLPAATPAEAAKAPTGRTYFVVSIGLSTDGAEAYEPDVGCIRFTRSEMCESDGSCGEWWSLEDPERAPRQSPFGFRFEFIDDETGTAVEVDGFGRIDLRGPKSSVAAVGEAVDVESGVKINFAIAGRAVGPARCEQLVEDYLAGR